MKMTNFYITGKEYKNYSDGPMMVSESTFGDYLKSNRKRIREEVYVIYPRSYLITTVGENHIISIPLDHPFDDQTLKMFLRKKENKTLYFIKRNDDDTEYITYEVQIKQEIFKPDLKKEFRIGICEYDRTKDSQENIIYDLY